MHALSFPQAVDHKVIPGKISRLKEGIWQAYNHSLLNKKEIVANLALGILAGGLFIWHRNDLDLLNFTMGTFFNAEEISIKASDPGKLFTPNAFFSGIEWDFKKIPEGVCVNSKNVAQSSFETSSLFFPALAVVVVAGTFFGSYFLLRKLFSKAAATVQVVVPRPHPNAGAQTPFNKVKGALSALLLPIKLMPVQHFLEEYNLLEKSLLIDFFSKEPDFIREAFFIELSKFYPKNHPEVLPFALKVMQKINGHKEYLSGRMPDGWVFLDGIDELVLNPEGAHEKFLNLTLFFDLTQDPLACFLKYYNEILLKFDLKLSIALEKI